ncbi:uncharacterized protein LOC117956033 [Etheostoma cragini]|uniref:uncharacterized protein LOC117956033 n=1 Tax=Etheostoma cragini TaxID=417921 RepID=UPI00155EC93B|nr:uncharacterized protein LOC117956033 [Etheostoma cragini]
MSLKLLEARWKPALSSILEELTDPDFRKMLSNLVKIPQGLKTGKTREEIPYLIVQHYGTEGSISEIDKIMKIIPRLDAAVQEQLRPFVEKLKKQRQGKKGTTRKLSINFGSVAKKQKLTADQVKSCPPVQVRETKTDRVKAAKPKKKKEKRDPSLEHQPSASPSTNVDPVGDVETGKKTEDRDLSLKPAESIKTFKMDPVGDVKPEQKTEGQDASLKPAAPPKTFKVLSAEVQTGRIQIVEIKKSNKTNIHLLVELNGRKRTVFLTNQLLANALGLEVEEDVERRLRHQMPLTAEATLQGRQITDIKQMDPVGDVKPEQKTEGQDASLKPAAPPKTFKVLSAEVQTGRIQIVGIKKSNKTNTHLVVEFNGRKRTVFVRTRILAIAFGLEVDDGFERRLRYQMPLTAEAKLHGKKVTEIKKMSLKLLEAKWKPVLSSILEELTDPDFRKMLSNLVQIPQGLKTGKTREEIPDLIVQHYGTEGSISEIDKIMKIIPRLDAAVQEQLRPFVEKLEKQRQGKKEMTRKLSADSGSVAKKQKPAADQLKSGPPVQVRETKKKSVSLGSKAPAGNAAQSTNEKKRKKRTHCASVS